MATWLEREVNGLSFIEQPRSTSQSIRARSPQAAARLAQPSPSNPSARAHSTSGKSPEARGSSLSVIGRRGGEWESGRCSTPKLHRQWAASKRARHSRAQVDTRPAWGIQAVAPAARHGQTVGKAKPLCTGGGARRAHASRAGEVTLLRSGVKNRILRPLATLLGRAVACCMPPHTFSRCCCCLLLACSASACCCRIVRQRVRHDRATEKRSSWRRAVSNKVKDGQCGGGECSGCRPLGNA